MMMSTLIGISDLAEDEVIPRPLPVEIFLRNVHFNVVEDRPPVNITSPGPVPIKVAIGEMKIMRDSEGTIHLQPTINAFRSEAIAAANDTRQPERVKEILSLHLILKQLKLENESLMRQVKLGDKQQEHNR